MIRRSVALALGALALGTVLAPALAGASTAPKQSALVIGPKLGQQSLCVGASNGDPGSLDGVCIWIPGS